MSKITTTTTILGNGETITKHHNSFNQLHSSEGPAVYTPYSEEWWLNGKLHRTNGPAILINKPNYIRAEWWKDGTLHRDNNKPVIIDSDGTIEYWELGSKTK